MLTSASLAGGLEGGLEGKVARVAGALGVHVCPGHGLALRRDVGRDRSSRAALLLGAGGGGRASSGVEQGVAGHQRGGDEDLIDNKDLGGAGRHIGLQDQGTVHADVPGNRTADLRSQGWSGGPSEG